MLKKIGLPLNKIDITLQLIDWYILLFDQFLSRNYQKLIVWFYWFSVYREVFQKNYNEKKTAESLKGTN